MARCGSQHLIVRRCYRSLELAVDSETVAAPVARINHLAFFVKMTTAQPPLVSRSIANNLPRGVFKFRHAKDGIWLIVLRRIVQDDAGQVHLETLIS
jgi:hypothetical protein